MQLIKATKVYGSEKKQKNKKTRDRLVVIIGLTQQKNLLNLSQFNPKISQNKLNQMDYNHTRH